MRRFALSLAVMLSTWSAPVIAADPTCQGITGTWHNQLGSTLKIDAVDSTTGAIKGQYSTSTGATGWYPLTGRVNTKSPAPRIEEGVEASSEDALTVQLARELRVFRLSVVPGGRVGPLWLGHHAHRERSRSEDTSGSPRDTDSTGQLRDSLTWRLGSTQGFGTLNRPEFAGDSGVP